MPRSPAVPAGDDPLRGEAADWFARMRGPDAERYRAAFEAWRAAHPSHRAAYDRMELRWGQSGVVGHTPSGQARAGLPPRPVRRVSAARLALAASLVGIAGSAALLWVSQRDAVAPAAVVARSELASPVGTIRRIELPDGSRVVLDTATRLSLAFTAGERRLRLVEGRARFEVAKDATRPFIVMAGEREVVAIGTVFEISLLPGAPRVQLIEGAVEVRAAPGSVVPVRALAPGQQLALDRAEAVPALANMVETRWAWGMLSFEDAPLGEVLAALNRYSARKIVLAEPGLAQLRVTASFRIGDPDKLAAALAAALALEVGARGDAIELRRGPGDQSSSRPAASDRK